MRAAAGSRQRAVPRVVLGAGLVGVLLGVLLGGCSGNDSQPSPPTPAASPAASPSASPSVVASAPPSETDAATPPVLAGSALAIPKGYTYTAIAGADGVPPEVDALAGFFDGYVGRTVNRAGKPVGTLQLLRTKAGVLGSAEAGDKVLQEFLKGFSRATSFDRQAVAGHDVLLAAVPGSTATVAGWRQGRDLILLFAAPSLSPTGFARSYITASRPTATPP